MKQFFFLFIGLITSINSSLFSMQLHKYDCDGAVTNLYEKYFPIDPLNMHLPPHSFSLDGKFYAVAQGQGIEIYDAQSWVHLYSLKSRVKNLTFLNLCFSKTGKKLAVVSSMSSIFVWDVETQEMDTSISNINTSEISNVILSPSDRYIAIGYSDGRIEIVDLKLFNRVYALRGHTGSIIDINFNDNETLIVSASDDKTVRIWSFTAASELYEPLTPNNRILSVSFANEEGVITAKAENLKYKLSFKNNKKMIKYPSISYLFIEQ